MEAGVFALGDVLEGARLELDVWLEPVAFDQVDHMEAPELLPLEDDTVLVLSDALLEVESRLGMGTGPAD